MKVLMLLGAFYFEGSNTMKETQDFGALYEPQSVVFSFDTVGWKLLALSIVLFIIIGFVIKVRHYHHNRYRREALNTIKQLPAEELTIYCLFSILKKTAIDVFGRKIVGPMFGREWLTFLDKTGKDVYFIKYEKSILSAIYEGVNPDAEVMHEIIVNTQKWIKTHAV